MPHWGCELLSKILYLCSLKQRMNSLCSCFPVVNCFQKSCIFALWNNFIIKMSNFSMLWIAFKNLVSLLFETTKALESANQDMLWIAFKNLVSLLFETTRWAWPSVRVRLWIAFKNLVSLLFETTFDNVFTDILTLWIAFKNLVSLLFETTSNMLLPWQICCELLSKILYLCSLKQPKLA